jgi:hypothetical protein
MKYNQIQDLTYEKFRRLTGIKRKTFEKMLEILKKDDESKKIKGGRKNKLSLENQLLMAPEYLREYRTYFHISKSYGVSESKKGSFLSHLWTFLGKNYFPWRI